MSVPDDLSGRTGGAQAPPSLVVMAAGIGSRYGGLKQVEPVGPSGEIILDYSVYDAIRAGFGRVVFVIRREIETDFRESVGRRIEPRVDTDYVYQDLAALPEGYEVPAGRVKPWGTGHAVLCARDAVPGAFAAINADDFYGPGAFAAVGKYLAKLSPGRDRNEEDESSDSVDDYCMAGYRLGNTLSEHGHVSRGVCSVTVDGFLDGIVERERVERFEDGIRYASGGAERDLEWVPLPGDTTVSMNLWGFEASFFCRLRSAFREFIVHSGSELKSELYLPAVVNDLIDEGAARVRVLPTDERWFGITHREDTPAVRSAILSRVEAGVYPEKLWS